MLPEAFNLYHTLKSALNEESAKIIVEALNEHIKIQTIKHVEMKIENLASKNDLANSGSRLESNITKNNIDLLKWTFFFMLWQTALLIGVMKYML